jgi:amino acid adenylation domain-containing protein
MLVQDFLENSAIRSPAKEALIAGANRFTYRQLNRAANRFAHALREGGVTYGDRVAIMMDNSAEAVISMWGALKAGATFLIINPTTKTRKVTYILNNCRAAALVTKVAKLKIIGDAITAAPSLTSVFLAGESSATDPPPAESSPAFLSWARAVEWQPAEAPELSSIDIDLAALIYTSGTTGSPKGVMLSHRNILSASTSITTYLENVEEDIILSVLPLSFDYGLYQAIMAAQFGGTLVLEKSFAYPFRVLELLIKEKATGFPVVPTMAAILLELSDLDPAAYDHVRYLSSTAAALHVNHIRGLQAIFRNADIYSMYGLTECKRVSYLPPEDLDRKPTSVGKGMPNEQVYLVDENDKVIREAGVVGELVVRGANVMQGYWELPEETTRMLKPGIHPWEKVLYTGDLFKQDEEGYLYFVSRKDDIIKSRGEKVSPKEVEAVLCGIDGVVESAVVGIADPVLGEAIKAYVVLKRGSTITEKEILAHCRRNLEDFMVPKYVQPVEALPKTSSGKITKKHL